MEYHENLRVSGTSRLGLGRSSEYETQSRNFLREDTKLTDERAFTSLLRESVCESIIDTLGKDVLSILVSKGLLDHVEEPASLERQLSSTFGNASAMLQRIIVKGLYQKLRIPYDSIVSFDYGKALDVARDVLYVENRRR